MFTDTLLALEKTAHAYLIRIDDVTPEEFDRMTDEDTKAELIDGVMIIHSPAIWEHNDVTEFIGALMDLSMQSRSRHCFCPSRTRADSFA